VGSIGEKVSSKIIGVEVSKRDVVDCEKNMFRLGYDCIGCGVDSTVWSRQNDKTVLKIMEAKNAKAALAWYRLIKKNPRKHFIRVFNITSFWIRSTKFYLIRLEKLAKMGTQQQKRFRRWWDQYYSLFSTVVYPGHKLTQLLAYVFNLGKKCNFMVDFIDSRKHSFRNVMLRQGVPVIIDPWAEWLVR
jgi:hypothetical protein